MSQFLDPLLTLVLNYGYPIICLSIMCGYLGIPIPADALLLAAGSFSSAGVLNLFILIPVVVITAITGDLIGYFLGYRFGHLILNKVTKKLGLTQLKLDSMDSFLNKWGIWCVFITRWLLTPLGIPVNLAAGNSRYPFKKFLLAAIAGEILWAGGYIYLGYIFGNNWETLLEYINGAPQILALAVLGIGSVMLAYHLQKRRRKMNNL